MNINTYEIAKQVTFKYCQVPLLQENPFVIEDVKKFIDRLISDISIELKNNNKTLKQFLDDDNFEDIDLEDIIYNIVIVLHCGALDSFLKYDDNVSDRFYEHYLNTFDIEIGEFIVSLLKEQC